MNGELGLAVEDANKSMKTYIIVFISARPMPNFFARKSLKNISRSFTYPAHYPPTAQLDVLNTQPGGGRIPRSATDPLVGLLEQPRHHEAPAKNKPIKNEKGP